MKSIWFTIVAAMPLLGGCSKSDDVAIVPNEMHFSANYPAVTRATDNSFEQGDVMGVYVTQYEGEIAVPLQVSGNYANNVQTTFDGTTWKSMPTIYWPEGKVDVYAYYPYAKPASVDEYAFAVALDQSTNETEDELGGYEMSDLMWAKAMNIGRIEQVPLIFSHCMSRIVVRLVKGEDYSGDIPADAVVRIHNTVPEAVVDLATGIVSKNGYASAQSITAKKIGDNVYAAIIVPQRLDTKRPLVEVLAKGVSYLVESSFVFKAGTQHNINITLDNNPDKVKIELGGEIEGGWTE